MSFAKIVSTHKASSDGGTSVTTDAVNTTGCDLIILVVACELGASAVPGDNKSNTYVTHAAIAAAGTSPQLFFSYLINPTVGSGHTFSYTGAFSFPSIAMIGLSGVDLVDGYEAQFTNVSSSSNVTSVAPGSITPAHDNDLVISGIAMDAANSTPSIGGGFTVDEYSDFSGGNAYNVGLAHLIQTTATAANPTWSWVTACRAVPFLATFKAAAGAAVTTGRGTISR